MEVEEKNGGSVMRQSKFVFRREVLSLSPLEGSSTATLTTASKYRCAFDGRFVSLKTAASLAALTAGYSYNAPRY